MVKRQKIEWLDGVSFQIIPKDTNWAKIGGVYIFAGANDQNQWRALYVGQTSSFADRIPGHNQWSKARLLGATHVHARVVPDRSDRLTLEKRLRKAFRPPLNDE